MNARAPWIGRGTLYLQVEGAARTVLPAMKAAERIKVVSCILKFVLVVINSVSLFCRSSI